MTTSRDHSGKAKASCLLLMHRHATILQLAGQMREAIDQSIGHSNSHGLPRNMYTVRDFMAVVRSGAELDNLQVRYWI